MRLALVALLLTVSSIARAQHSPAGPLGGGPDEPLREDTARELDQLMLRSLPQLEPAEREETLQMLDAEQMSASAAEAAPRERVPFWGPERPFLAGMIDLGFLFLEPRFHFGYGVPHEIWAGAEIDPIIAGSGIGVYAGLRGVLPWGDLRIGGRYRYNWTRSFLEALDGYDDLQFRDRVGPNAHYLSLESQLSLDIPVDDTAFVSELTVTYVIPFQQGTFVGLYEDTLRVVTIVPGWIWSIALGWRFHFGPDGAIYVEPGGELVHLVERDEFVVRVGFNAGIHLWPDLSVRMTVMPAILSPDDIGASGGHTFLLGLRYQWAMDAPRFGT